MNKYDLRNGGLNIAEPQAADNSQTVEICPKGKKYYLVVSGNTELRTKCGYVSK